MKDVVVCPLCGEHMREERGQRNTFKGVTSTIYRCPRCLHEEKVREANQERK